MTRPTVGYAGMTHLGINSAAASAARGFKTICFDSDAGNVKRLAAFDPPVVEPGLRDLMSGHRSNLCFTSDAAELARCDVVYVSSDVPTDDVGRSDLSGIRALIDVISRHLAKSSQLVVLCQVPPGFTRSLAVPAERLYYQVETLVFGRAVERAMYPERFMIGCADPGRAIPESLSRFLLAFECPVLTMRYESAELAKIAINCCLVASVTVANTLAELSECVGADWGEIVPALRLDRRIGPHAYLDPGLGLAGGNLERDLATLVSLADETGSHMDLVRAFIANSLHRRDWALRVLWKTTLTRVQDPLIAVLGLAYKKDTNSIKNSASIALLESLRSVRMRVFDPVVQASPMPSSMHEGAKSELDACKGADALVVMTPWDQFRGIDLHAIAKQMTGNVVLDPYGLLNAAECRTCGLVRYTLGVG